MKLNTLPQSTFNGQGRSRYRLIEFLLIYILLPISFMFDYSFKLKASLTIVGFIYVLYILLRVEKVKFKLRPRIKWRSYGVQVTLKMLAIAALTMIYMWLTAADHLFKMFVEKPQLWVLILFMYAMFSVYPQEIVYRTFYFRRYQRLFRNKGVLMLVNALVFALGHLFYRNTLVLLITFMGGALFALTYMSTRSTFLVSLEHALYGCWLFTVGMGPMLGFPE